MISEIDKLTRIIKNELGNKISDKENKYLYDLKYVYNAINQYDETTDWSQLFIVWCFIKAFGKVRAFELLHILPDNLETLTTVEMRKFAENSYSYVQMGDDLYYFLFRADPCDQILYLENQSIHAGSIVDIYSDSVKIIEIDNEGIVAEKLFTEYFLKNNVIGLIKCFRLKQEEFL